MKNGRKNSRCKSCVLAISNTYYYKNKKHYITKVRDRQKENIKRFKTFKATLHCTNCGEKETCCLDFHHLDADVKELDLSRTMRGYAWSRIVKELEKCVVLCRNCHAKVHAGVVVLVNPEPLVVEDRA